MCNALLYCERPWNDCYLLESSKAISDSSKLDLMCQFILMNFEHINLRRPFYNAKRARLHFVRMLLWTVRARDLICVCVVVASCCVLSRSDAFAARWLHPALRWRTDRKFHLEVPYTCSHI